MRCPIRKNQAVAARPRLDARDLSAVRGGTITDGRVIGVRIVNADTLNADTASAP